MIYVIFEISQVAPVHGLAQPTAGPFPTVISFAHASQILLTWV